MPVLWDLVRDCAAEEDVDDMNCIDTGLAPRNLELGCGMDVWSDSESGPDDACARAEGPRANPVASRPPCLA